MAIRDTHESERPDVGAMLELKQLLQAAEEPGAPVGIGEVLWMKVAGLACFITASKSSVDQPPEQPSS